MAQVVIRTDDGEELVSIVVARTTTGQEPWPVSLEEELETQGSPALRTIQAAVADALDKEERRGARPHS